MRVFEEEVYGAKSLWSFKSTLLESCNSDIDQLFKLVDKESRGYIDIRDLYNFMSEHLGTTTYQRAERVLRRLDLDSDGKVDFAEFEIGLLDQSPESNPEDEKKQSEKSVSKHSQAQEEIEEKRRPSPSRYSKVPQRSP